jgi:hypothetical protein
MGRNEMQLAWDTLFKARERFPYKPNETESNYDRLSVIHPLKRFSELFRDDETGESETVKVLRNELNLAIKARDYEYLYQLINILHDDFQELHAEFFVNTDLFLKAIATRKEWDIYDSYKIEIAAESDKWNPTERRKFFDQLAVIARQNLKTRGFALASVLPKEENNLAIALLYDCLKIAPDDYDQYINFTRIDVYEELISKHLDSNDWKSAEAVYRKEPFRLKLALRRIALTAAENGQIADTVRLWKIKTNFDRRDLVILDQIAKTPAKDALRKFYSEMKTNGELTEIADSALKYLE